MTVAQNPLFRWQKALRDSELSPSARLVALTLSTYMNAQGEECFPSVPTLAHDTGLSVRAVQYALRQLEAGQWLSTTFRTHRRGDPTSSRYVAICTQVVQPLHHLVQPLHHHDDQTTYQPTVEGKDLPSVDLPPLRAGLAASADMEGTVTRPKEEPWGGEVLGAARDQAPSGRTVQGGRKWVKPSVEELRLRRAFKARFGAYAEERKIRLADPVKKMHGGLRWMLQNHYTVDQVLATFEIFSKQLHGIAWRGQSVWDEYFRRKSDLVKQVATTRIGTRGEHMTTMGDLAREAQERRNHADH
jgi:hypothetical protein